MFAKRPPVTEALCGSQNFGSALDVGIFEHGEYFEGNVTEEDKAYVGHAEVLTD